MTFSLTSNLDTWHKAFADNIAPRQIANFATSPVSSFCAVRYPSYSGKICNSSFQMISKYDDILYDISQAWIYPSLLIYSVKVAAGEFKRFLSTPSNQVAYDPHPIWLNGLGLLQRIFDLHEFLDSEVTHNIKFYINSYVPEYASVESIQFNKPTVLINGSFNYSHFLIDSLADLSVVEQFSKFLNLSIVDVPSWAGKLIDRLGAMRLSISDQASDVMVYRVRNVVICHVPSYQRRGQLARLFFKNRLLTTNQTGNRLSSRPYKSCFLARDSSETPRIINQTEVLNWCNIMDIDILYPSRLTLGQKRNLLSKYNFFICDGGSTINNILLFGHSLLACISIVPRSFLVSPYHCLGGMQYLRTIQESIVYSIHVVEGERVNSGPVDAVTVNISDLEKQFLVATQKWLGI